MEPQQLITLFQQRVEAHEWETPKQKKDALEFIVNVEKMLVLDPEQGTMLSNVIRRVATSLGIHLPENNTDDKKNGS